MNIFQAWKKKKKIPISIAVNDLYKTEGKIILQEEYISEKTLRLEFPTNRNKN